MSETAGRSGKTAECLVLGRKGCKAFIRLEYYGIGEERNGVEESEDEEKGCRGHGEIYRMSSSLQTEGHEDKPSFVPLCLYSWLR